ncbi:flavin reductase family protein [Streptomyces sp. NPDC048639]|uniref:flavin reductase family protein n=1 Tax=Streptomyces sp. NPDC048639 TaxID=3365581 RepID=UPI00371A2CB4
MMGHAGMAATAVRYLRSVGSPVSAARHPVDPLPRPDLRAVREDERLPVDPAEFRRVLGHFASGVTVITAPGTRGDTAAGGNPAGGRATDGNAAAVSTTAANARGGLPPGEGPAGFACQSFASLSLDPPLIAFMVGRTSTTWPRIARAGVFCVNIMGAEQGGLCRDFAVSSERRPDKFAGVAHDAAPVTGSPRLNGVPAWIDCTVHAVHTGGDHLIVVGRVEALGTDEAAAAAGPLLFHRGIFGGFSG